MLSEISKTHRDKYCRISSICGIQKKSMELKEAESTKMDTMGRVAGSNEEMMVKGTKFRYKVNKFCKLNYSIVTMMVNFMYQLDSPEGCPDNGKTLFLSVPVWAFLKEISI